MNNVTARGNLLALVEELKMDLDDLRHERSKQMGMAEAITTGAIERLKTRIKEVLHRFKLIPADLDEYKGPPELPASVPVFVLNKDGESWRAVGALTAAPEWKNTPCHGRTAEEAIGRWITVNRPDLVGVNR